MKNKKLFIAGEYGFVGKNLSIHFESKGEYNLIHAAPDLDFRLQESVNSFISNEKPEIIILTAGKVGGILANKKYPAEFLYDNLMIWNNIIKAAAENNVSKLIFLGSATVYPKNAQIPFKEECLLSGELEKNTEAYAIAKITAIKLCEALYKAEKCNFIPLTLANLYGPLDHFNFEDSHLIPALISKIHKAKLENSDKVILWGTGKPTRDLLYINDLIDAIEFILNNIEASNIFEDNISHINVGSGIEYSILEIAETIKKIVNYNGEIIFDSNKPDGTMRKLLDVSRLAKLGWHAQTELAEGLQKTYNYFLTTI